MKKIILLVLLLLIAQWWFTNPTISVPTNDITFSYSVEYTEISNKNDSLPMLVVLHGNGDTPYNFYTAALDELSVPVRIILLEGPIEMGTGYAWPWTSNDFNHYGKAVNEAIELLANKYPTLQKPILLGFSGGAMMAYYQALKHGDSYSYIFPISGQFSHELLNDSSTRIDAKVYSYHGNKDKVVSINGARNALKILKGNGISINLIEFDGGHHGIATTMKSNITNAVENKISSLN